MRTMSSPELDRLIIEHLHDLDAAATRIDQLTEKVWKVQGETLQAWAAGSGWNGGFDPDDDLCVWPLEIEGEDGEPVGRFLAGHGVDEEESDRRFILTALSGVAGGRVCLWFEHTAPKKQWKPLASQRAEELAALGFIMTDRGNFFTDCTPTQAEMAQGLEIDDLSDVMAHLVRALARAAKAAPVFLDMLRQLKAI